MSEAPETLDDLVRRVDPDRWLASRFIEDARARADVIALYAFNHELARVAHTVREPLMGEIRLTWWREAIEEISAGKPPRAHPVIEALATANLPGADLGDLPERRLADLEQGPFETDEQLFQYLDDTAGKMMALAARRLDPAVVFEQVRGAARAFGLAGLWRTKSAGVRSRLPAWALEDLRVRVAAELTAARAELATLPVAAFPAVAYATLAKPYSTGRDLGELEKRVRLTFSVLRGRI